MKPLLCRRTVSCLVIAGALLLGSFGCRVQKQGEGENKKVDIQTPMGSLHVNTKVDPRDTGLAIYPNATRAEDADKEHAANVNIDSNLFGAKIVAVKYRSDDPPDKLLEFYRKQLKSYGEVTECRGSISFNHGEMRCRAGANRHDETKLVAGTEERHHIVSVRPQGKGSEFGLVYIQTRGEKDTM